MQHKGIANKRLCDHVCVKSGFWSSRKRIDSLRITLTGTARDQPGIPASMGQDVSVDGDGFWGYVVKDCFRHDISSHLVLTICIYSSGVVDL